MDKIICASILLLDMYFESHQKIMLRFLRLCHLGSTALDDIACRTFPGTAVAITPIVANAAHLPGLADELLPFATSTRIVALEGREGIASIPAQAACGGGHSPESRRGC